MFLGRGCDGFILSNNLTRLGFDGKRSIQSAHIVANSENGDGSLAGVDIIGIFDPEILVLFQSADFHLRGERLSGVDIGGLIQCCLHGGNGGSGGFLGIIAVQLQEGLQAGPAAQGQIKVIILSTNRFLRSGPGEIRQQLFDRKVYDLALALGPLVEAADYVGIRAVDDLQIPLRTDSCQHYTMGGCAQSDPVPLTAVHKHQDGAPLGQAFHHLFRCRVNILSPVGVDFRGYSAVFQNFLQSIIAQRLVLVQRHVLPGGDLLQTAGHQPVHSHLRHTVGLTHRCNGTDRAAMGRQIRSIGLVLLLLLTNQLVLAVGVARVCTVFHGENRRVRSRVLLRVPGPGGGPETEHHNLIQLGSVGLAQLNFGSARSNPLQYAGALVHTDHLGIAADKVRPRRGFVFQLQAQFSVQLEIQVCLLNKIFPLIRVRRRLGRCGADRRRALVRCIPFHRCIWLSPLFRSLVLSALLRFRFWLFRLVFYGAAVADTLHAAFLRFRKNLCFLLGCRIRLFRGFRLLHCTGSAYQAQTHGKRHQQRSCPFESLFHRNTPLQFRCPYKAFSHSTVVSHTAKQMPSEAPQSQLREIITILMLQFNSLQHFCQIYL